MPRANVNEKPFEQVRFENAKIIFKHFNGARDDFHAEGKRDYCIEIDESTAKDLADKGVAVKPLTSRDPDEEPKYYVKVRINWGQDANGRKFGPRVWMYTDKVKRPLTDANVGILDDAWIENADVVTHIYRRHTQGKDTATLYTDILHVMTKESTREDPFAAKYAQYDDPDECPF